MQIQNLSVSFRQDGNTVEVIRNISFEIGRAEIIAIAGESGSGKSLTALSITGLLPANARIRGSVMLEDPATGPTELLHQKKIQKIRGSRISMIFQEPMTSLNPLMRCGYQVAEAYKTAKKSTAQKAKQEAMEALNLAGFSIPQNVYDRYPHQLSGGQKQRVMIAMAIVCRPMLLIADEPTTALDVRIQKEILLSLANLRNQLGMSVLLISHDLGIISDIADRVLIMNKGELVDRGSTLSLLQHPNHPYTKALLQCRVAGYPKGIRLPSMQQVLQESPNQITTDNTACRTASATTVLIRAENLSVLHQSGGGRRTQERIKAVDDVSFSIYRNEILGLVGESGCGKTSLGRTLLGLIRPDEGRVLLNGKDIQLARGRERSQLHRELQIVFQDPYGSLNPRLSAGDAIMEVLRVHDIGINAGSRKEKVIDLLEKVNLEADHYARYPHQFSGGQRQRICIARALAAAPSFIVFDEALSALDVSIQAQVLNLINDLKNLFGFTALFISHDLAMVNYISDRIMVMRSGKIIEAGPAEEIFSQPRHDYTRLLLESVPGKNLPRISVTD